MLTVAPFFSLTVHYENLTKKMFEFVAFIFVLIVMRGVVKKIIGMKGDIIYGDRSIPIVYGERTARLSILVLSILSIGQIVFFIRFLVEGPIRFYFFAVIVIQVIIGFLIARQGRETMVNAALKWPLRVKSR